MAVIKAIIAAVKALVAAIAAGGWVAVAVILVICLIGLLLGSIFGIFFSNETDESKPMSIAVAQIDTEFQVGIDAKIEELKAGGIYDEVRVFYDGDGDGDSSSVNNWSDVLAVYAVLLNTDETAGMEVLTITPEKIEWLKQTFEDMNEVRYEAEVIQEERTQINGDGEEETVTVSILIVRININSMGYEQAADHYHMTAKQRDLLEELMQPEYASLFTSLLDVDIMGGANLTGIISGLPAGTIGAEVVKAGAQKLGNTYVWGAKGPNKFDCSGLVYWAIQEVNASLGSQFYTSAAGQAKWCYDNGRVVGRNELQPGDLVFWQNLGCSGCSRWEEVHHVGIYVGDGKVLEASSSKGRVLIRDLWESSGYPIYMFARL